MTYDFEKISKTKSELCEVLDKSGVTVAEGMATLISLYVEALCAQADDGDIKSVESIIDRTAEAMKEFSRSTLATLATNQVKH